MSGCSAFAGISGNNIRSRSAFIFVLESFPPQLVSTQFVLIGVALKTKGFLPHRLVKRVAGLRTKRLGLSQQLIDLATPTLHGDPTYRGNFNI